MRRRQRNFARPHEVEVIVCGLVDLLLVRRKEARSFHRLPAHQDGRDHRREPIREQEVEHVAAQRQPQQRPGALQIREARSRGARAPLDVDDAERFADVEVILRLEVELRQLADAIQLDVVLVARSRRHALVWDVRYLEQHVAELRRRCGLLCFERGDLIGQALQPCELSGLLRALQRRDALVALLPLRAQLVDPCLRRAAARVRLEDGVDRIRAAAPREGSSNGIGIFADQLEIKHRDAPPAGTTPTPSPRGSWCEAIRSRTGPAARRRGLPCR